MNEKPKKGNINSKSPLRGTAMGCFYPLSIFQSLVPSASLQVYFESTSHGQFLLLQQLSLFLMEIFISMIVSMNGIMMEVSLLNMLKDVEMGIGVTEMIRKLFNMTT